MTGETYRDYIALRGKNYYYRRWVPKEVKKLWKHAPKNDIISVSLRTKSPELALIAGKHVHDEHERMFSEIKLGLEPDAGRYEKAISTARAYSLQYLTAEELAHQPIEKRLQHVKVAMKAKSNFVMETALGSVEPPKLLLSGALERLYEIKQTSTANKSANQLRKWKNPRLKAVNSLKKLIGDKPFYEITRQDVQKFHKWWTNRIANEGLTTGTAGKDFIHLRTLFQSIKNYDQVEVKNPFDGIGFTENSKKRRDPWEVEDLIRLIQPNSLRTRRETLAVLLAMVETGARPSELILLREEDIFLKHNIPHIHIQPYAGHELKTFESDRKIPLVGISLEVFREFPKGFTSINSPDSWSNSINSAIKRSKITRPGVTAYGIRHAFKERMRNANFNQRMAEELMGHVVRSESVIYGRAAPLEQTAPLLETMALPLP